ncbi:MAG: hypothetical protein AAFP20_25750, partial [Cyanobacteria bacterium J06614_10]
MHYPNNERVGYPRKWKEYCDQLPQGFSIFGLTSIGDVSRFGARYRAAYCFQGIMLDGYSESTADGYSSLTRVMFTWSAFETLLSIKNKHPKDADTA